MSVDCWYLQVQLDHSSLSLTLKVYR